jgi:hypothetical protein
LTVKKDPCGTRSSPLHCYQIIFFFVSICFAVKSSPSTNVVHVEMHIFLTIKRNVKIVTEDLNHSFTQYVCSSYIVQRVYFAVSSSFSEAPDQENL